MKRGEPEYRPAEAARCLHAAVEHIDLVLKGNTITGIMPDAKIIAEQGARYKGKRC